MQPELKRRLDEIEDELVVLQEHMNATVELLEQMAPAILSSEDTYEEISHTPSINFSDRAKE